MLTLAELRPGMRADIVSVDPSTPGVVRLMVLGLVEGASVLCKNAAFGGDPLEISVCGTAISIRRDQARHFSVSAPGVHG